MPTSLLSYHNDPAVKAKYTQRFAEHRAADAVVQGLGYSDGHGCFVGCTLQNYDHALFPVELGWPEWLARLADGIFESLPRGEAPQFGTDLLEAVPLGKDLDAIRTPFLIGVQMRNLARLEGNTEPYAEQCRAAIREVIDFLKADKNDESAAWSARSAAARSAAAESAAWSARSAAARSAAAESAAWSARSAAARSAAAESAARSAAWSARSAAWSAEGQSQRDLLLTLLRGL